MVLSQKIHGAFKGAVERMTGPRTVSDFKEKGVLSVSEFILADDNLVSKYPTWKAGDPSKRKPYLPSQKQFLITKNGRCQIRDRQREMARQAGKQNCGRLVLVSCLALLAVGLVADFLWASSHRFSPAGTYLPSSFTTIIGQLPPESNEKDTKQKEEDKAEERKLSATFQDLDAPQLQWEKMAAAPVPRLDGAAIQIMNLLYVFSGYGNINLVRSHVDVYNFVDNKWGGRFDMPKEMAHSHLGMRFIYIVTGQYGPQCRGPTAKTFVLDTDTNTWSDFIPLPVPRYAPATQLWRDGKALEKEWRSEIPIPRGGPHRACVVVDDRIFVIGGQEGDFMVKPGSPIFKCSCRLEVKKSEREEHWEWKDHESL
ncbi:unnamed protein product [Brassica rapa subsp. trilocularis]